MPSYPRLLYWIPSDMAGIKATELRPDISLDWSDDMETTQFSDPAQLQKIISLQPSDDDDTIPLTFVSYDSSLNRVILKPSVDLDYGKQYTLYVKPGVKSTYGRSSNQNYILTFTVEESGIGKPVLLSPPNYSIQQTFPTLVWLVPSATGTVNSEIEIDNNPSFTSVVWTNIVAGSSITPVGSFQSETTYYWRVRSFNDSATGGWSDTGAFFYGQIGSVHDDTRQTWVDVDTFGLKSHTVYELTNLSSWPTLRFTFSSEPDDNFVNNVKVRKKPVVSRIDDSTSVDWADVPGTWTKTGKTLEFVPSESIEENTKYEVIFSPDLTNINGVLLEEREVITFTGKYNPLLVNPEMVYSLMGYELVKIPEDMVYFYIHVASLDARARFLTTLNSAPSEDQVRDPSVDLGDKYGIGRWVAAMAAKQCLLRVLVEEARNVGRERSLGDYKESLSKDLINAIKQALEELEKELEKWETLLGPGDYLTGVSKSDRWSPYSWAYDDYSLTVGEGDWGFVDL